LLDLYKATCSNPTIQKEGFETTSLKNTMDKEKPYTSHILINENATATASVSGTAPRSTKSFNDNYEKCK
jgi:hypothetical protein